MILQLWPNHRWFGSLGWFLDLISYIFSGMNPLLGWPNDATVTLFYQTDVVVFFF